MSLSPSPLRLALVTLASVCVVSCAVTTESRDAELVGAWQEMDGQRRLEFSADGTFDHLVAAGGGASRLVGGGKWRAENGELELELTTGTMSWLERTAASPSTVSWRYGVTGTTLVAEPAFGPTEQVRYVRIGPP